MMASLSFPLLAKTAAADSTTGSSGLWLLGAGGALLAVWILERVIASRNSARETGFQFAWLRPTAVMLGVIVACYALTKGIQYAAPLLPGHIWQNMLAIIIFGLVTIGFIQVIRHPFWGRRVRTIFRRPFVVISIVMALFFCLVALLDSISWIDNYGEEESKQLSVAATEPRSIVDRIFATCVGVPEYKFKETSFSVPLGDMEYGSTKKKLTYAGKHLMGTAIDGRDTLYSILKGCKPAVIVGTLPLLISIPLALFFGVMGGFFGGKIDDLVVYIYSTLASIPSLLLLFAIIMALGNGIFQVCVGLGVAGWVSLCRLSRGETLKLRELEYVQAARCLGVPDRKIILRHIIPNLMHIVIITAILAFTGLVLSEAVLSYLGIGLDNSWGQVINNSRNEISRQPVIWWNLVFASSALFFLVLSVNVIGDALRDALDPRISVGE